MPLPPVDHTVADKVGGIIRHYRKLAKLTLADVALPNGYTAAYLSAIELGSRRPPGDVSIAALLKTVGRRITERVREMAAAERISRKSTIIAELVRAGELAVYATGEARTKAVADWEEAKRKLASVGCLSPRGKNASVDAGSKAL